MIFLLHLPVLLLAIVPIAHSTPTVAVNQERITLLKNALGWMTFRKNGDLMRDSELESLFLQSLLNKYNEEKYYRTFVIAFHQGVIPRVVLKEGDYCDPDYRKDYMDPSNSSVTLHYLKKFTFDNYDDRDEDSDAEFCDYRLGLVCSHSSQQCECPEGSKMDKVDPYSDVKRCVLQENQVCSLIDLANGNDPKHLDLQKQLPYMIFNLEKPLGCKSGTQCRFKSGNKNTPLCYANNNGPWETGSWRLKLGDTCAIGLLGDAGTCEVLDSFVTTCDTTYGWPGLVCFNFGPPRSSGKSKMDNRIGVCHYENGQYGLTPISGGHYGGTPNKPSCFATPFLEFFFGVFIHPGTVPLREQELQDYYSKISNNYIPFVVGVQQFGTGGACSVDKTNKWKDIWKYFEGLEADPPVGQDYVAGATKAELDARLQEVLDMNSNQNQKKRVCKVYVEFATVSGGYRWEEQTASECVAKTPTSTDADGNDGTCTNYKGIARASSEKLKDKLTEDFRITKMEASENKNYRKEIIDENPELPCDPTRASLSARSLEALEGGECPEDSVCYQDFSDASGRFDDSCNLKPDARQVLLCHDVDISKLGKCEKTYMDSKVNQAMFNLADYASLTKGEPCHYNFEKAVRENDTEILAKYNPYQIMSWLEQGRLCNRLELNLECSPSEFCLCINGNCLHKPKPKRKKPITGGNGNLDKTDGNDGDESDNSNRNKVKTNGGAANRLRKNVAVVLLALVVSL